MDRKDREEAAANYKKYKEDRYTPTEKRKYMTPNYEADEADFNARKKANEAKDEVEGVYILTKPRPKDSFQFPRPCTKFPSGPSNPCSNPIYSLQCSTD
jgi:hypothetical protein